MSGGESEEEKGPSGGLFPGDDGGGKKPAESVTPARGDRRMGDGGAPREETVAGRSALDFTIPKIEKPKEKDILALFIYQELDKIIGEPKLQCQMKALRWIKTKHNRKTCNESECH